MLSEVDFKDLRRLLDNLGNDRRRSNLEDFAAQVYIIYAKANPDPNAHVDYLELQLRQRREREGDGDSLPAPPKKVDLKTAFANKLKEKMKPS